MTMASEILALAAKVEALVGPDRELDARIGCIVRSKPYIDTDSLHGKLMRQVARNLAPIYTGSLDVAAILVPQNMDWGIAYFGPRGSEAQAWPRGARDSADKVKGSSDASPALALAAAALRALASEVPSS